jgi:dienelactone hydrolase
MIGGISAIFILVITTALGSILPVFDLPEPTGSYLVGTTTFMLEDINREEIITVDPDDHRTLMVRAWYPSDDLKSDDIQMDYMHPFEAEYFAKKYGLPSFTLNHLRHIETFAYEDLNVSVQESTYPVLLFSHGYNVPPATYASFMSEIASHGYIIFAVNHPYQSVATVFPDGRKVTFDYQYESKNFKNVWEKIVKLEEKYWSAESDSLKRDIIREISDLYPNAEMMRQWTEDLSFVIDELKDINSEINNRFSGKLNLDRVGAFGHSAGGATAGQLMLTDQRVKAGINWDGAQWADMIDSTLAQPFLRIEAARDSAMFAPNDLIYHNGSDTAIYDLKVNGFGHSNFSDIPFLIPVESINEAGDADPYDATELINEYSLAFFDKYLRGDLTINLRDLGKKYPEVTLGVD